jgi:Tol biopolymer transport system component
LSDSKDFPDAWARDSTAILFESDRAGKFQIFRQQREHDTAQALIQGPDDERSATLSPDGAWILYWTTAHGELPPTSMRLMRSPTSGGSPEQVLEVPIEATPGFDCPSHPGSSCIFSRPEPDHLVFYALDPLQGLSKEVARTQGPTGRSEWSISPDGTRIAVEIANGLRIIDLRKGTERNLPFPWRLWSLSWAPDGRALFAAAQSTEYLIVRIELDGKTRVLLDRGRNQWLGFASPSPDGRYLAFSQQSFDSNVWLLENF